MVINAGKFANVAGKVADTIEKLAIDARKFIDIHGRCADTTKKCAIERAEEKGDPDIVIKLLTTSFAFVLMFAIGTVAQERTAEFYTDYPILKTGPFANRSYPAAPIMANSGTGDGRKSFRLVNGVFRPEFHKEGFIERTGAYLTKVEYADVTGDGRREAIAYILPMHQGNAVWYGIYVFSMSNGRPSKILWSFATGDRGVGGLKRVYGRKGRLVVELWGWNSGPDRPPTTHIVGQAGSSYFTRRTYKWDSRRFRQHGKTRIFKYTEPGDE